MGDVSHGGNGMALAPIRQAFQKVAGGLGRARGTFHRADGDSTVATPFVLYPIDPTPQTRRTRSETWKPRPGSSRYYAFRDDVRLRHVTAMRCGQGVIFLLPIPKSTSKKERARLMGTPHMNKPDVDNLEKALLDSIWPEGDQEVWDWRCSKLWWDRGAIIFYDAPPLPFTLPLQLEETP